MNPSDIVVLMCENVTEDQGINLMAWWLNGTYRAHINEPSVQWWVSKHACRIASLAGMQSVQYGHPPNNEWREVCGIRQRWSWAK